MSDKDLGFSKCDCGKWAVVISNGAKLCLECFQGYLKEMKSKFESLQRVANSIAKKSAEV